MTLRCTNNAGMKNHSLAIRSFSIRASVTLTETSPCSHARCTASQKDGVPGKDSSSCKVSSSSKKLYASSVPAASPGAVGMIVVVVELASYMLNTGTTTRRAQSFPRAASDRMSLSSVKFYTARRSRSFSLRSLFGSFNWSVPFWGPYCATPNSNSPPLIVLML